MSGPARATAADGVERAGQAPALIAACGDPFGFNNPMNYLAAEQANPSRDRGIEEALGPGAGDELRLYTGQANG